MKKKKMITCREGESEHITERHRTVLYSTILYFIVRYGTVRYGTILAFLTTRTVPYKYTILRINVYLHETYCERTRGLNSTF